MTTYLIDRNRFMLEYNQNLKMKSKGVLNWFISPDRILHLFIDVFSVTYLYKVSLTDLENDAVIKTLIDPRYSILGIYDDDKEKENQMLNSNIDVTNYTFEEDNRG